MEPLRFRGEYDLTLDDKSRVMIPAQLRRRIHGPTHGEDFVLIVAPNRTLWLYPNLYYEELHEGDKPDANPEADLLKFHWITDGMAADLELDKAGRVTLPEKSRKRANIVRDLTIVGNRDHLEIWDRALWDKVSEELLNNGQAAWDRARMIKRGESTYQTQTVTRMEGTL